MGNLRWANTEPSMHFRKTNTDLSMHFRKANTDPSMHFRKVNTEFLLPAAHLIISTNPTDSFISSLKDKEPLEAGWFYKRPIKEICYICSTISVWVSNESPKDCVWKFSFRLLWQIRKKQINSSTYLSNNYWEKEEEKENFLSQKESKRSCPENCSCPRREMPPPSSAT